MAISRLVAGLVFVGAWLASCAHAGGGPEVRLLQSGADNTARVAQSLAAHARITIDQGGMQNLIEATQAGGDANVIDAVQGGMRNAALLVQSVPAPGAGSNLLVLRQRGDAGAVAIRQAAAGATAAVLQSAASTGDRAVLFQAALAPIAVIEQGVAAPQDARPLDAASEAMLIRAGAPFAPAPGAPSTANVMQAGGAGLKALVVQGGGGQRAVVTQSGIYLEAQILQSGGAHVATLSQAGAGTAASPYRASITQAGAQPQSIAIQQIAGASPRVVQVIQR